MIEDCHRLRLMIESESNNGRVLPPVSAKQARILEVIVGWVEVYGYPPTVREIGSAVGLKSPSSVTHHLKALERHGLLRRASSPRTLRARVPWAPALERSDREVRVPLLGTVAVILGKVTCVLRRL